LDHPEITPPSIFNHLRDTTEHIAGFYKLASFAGVRIIILSEGEASELHIGLKGTMGALYLKDLAAKTHRGLEGRIRQGRSIGAAPFGYRIVRGLRPDGEPDRGLREIYPDQAIVVRRIFADFASGQSPRQIARALNAECIPSPNGGVWSNGTIRGRAARGEGILRNALYIGRLVWNRRHNLKDPTGGCRVRKANRVEDLVTHEVPELAILDPALWQRVQHQRELATVDRRIANLIDALADGIRAPDIVRCLAELQARRTELEAALEITAHRAPSMPTDMAAVYRTKLAHLSQALAGDLPTFCRPRRYGLQNTGGHHRRHPGRPRDAVFGKGGATGLALGGVRGRAPQEHSVSSGPLVPA